MTGKKRKGGKSAGTGLVPTCALALAALAGTLAQAAPGEPGSERGVAVEKVQTPAGQAVPALGAEPPPVVGPGEAGGEGAGGDAGGAAGAGAGDGDLGPVPPGHVRIGPYSEPVDVKLLIDFVASKSKIQIIASDIALADKKVWLLTPVDVPESRLLEFLSYLLERNGQYLTKEAEFVWIIKPVNDLQSSRVGNDPLSTTQILPTKGIRPTSLSTVLQTALRSSGGGVPGQPGPAGGVNVAYLDDMGVIVINDTPRRIALVQSIIDTISKEQIDLQFTRFEVRQISAITAKARILELLGRVTRNVVQGGQIDPNNPNQFLQQAGGGGAAGNISNVADRLIPEGNSNALILRGRPEEVALIRRLLEVVDVPNNLIPRWYPVGPAAIPLAEQARRQGLGDVTTLQSMRGSGGQQGQFFPGQFDGQGQPNFNQARIGQGGGDQAGPVFVLDPEQRGFMYYGTEQQHARVKQLVDEFREPIQSERVVYEFYKLRFADSEKTAEVIRGMITNTVPAGESPLVPGQGGGGAGQRRGGFQPFLTPEGIIAAIDGGGSGIGEIVASDQVFVLPDKGNNQVIVKAPQRLQPQFQRLIERLDQRRSQVYIDAKIVVVNDDEDFRLGIESQLINAEGTGGALRTIFDGSIAATAGTGGILGRPTVGTGPGINFAIIKSNMVPLVIDAFARTTDTRIVANPQLLVDDNEEAEISSIRQEATTTQTSVGGGTNPQFQTSFGGYQDAGPRLKVKPRISSGDLLSLEYEIELSSFDGTSSNGIPPPRSENKVSSKSATIPSDSTIVVGGLTLDDTRKVIFKVPLLGDIPLLGEAFKRTTDTKRRQTVYVFITPRIMRDPVGNDLRLFSRGPAAGVKVNTELPPITPEMIEIVAPGSRQGGGAPSEPAPGEPGNGAPGNGEPGNGEPAPGSEPAPATSGRSGNVPNLRFPSPTPASSAPASSTATRPTTPTPAPAPTGEASSPSRSQ